MRSEEEIKEVNDAIDAICTGHNDCPCTPIRVAITELLTLRRRLDREKIGKLIYYRLNTPEFFPWEEQNDSLKEYHRKHADAIIKYLTEGTDGE